MARGTTARHNLPQFKRTGIQVLKWAVVGRGYGKTHTLRLQQRNGSRRVTIGEAKRKRQAAHNLNDRTLLGWGKISSLTTTTTVSCSTASLDT